MNSLDLTTAETVLRPLLTPVLAALPDEADVPLLLVGAIARDVIHAALGHRGNLRRTSDLDLALAVAGSDHWNRFTAGLVRLPASSGIRFRIAGVTVDLVPFGDIEDPDGVVSRGGSEAMSVFAFREVWAGGHEFPIAGRWVRLPRVAGYAALKLKAWVDRSPRGEYKDAQDLACAMFWYQSSADVEDRLYSTDAGLELLVSVDFDVPRAANRLLMIDVGERIGRTRLRELVDVWGDVDDLRLAEQLRNPALPAWPNGSGDRRRQFVEDVRTSLR